jgi:heme/copper-type cytochrome/quinol oxidase subunit 3
MSSPALAARHTILPLETERGSLAMWLTILTEAFLFVALFCSYFLLANNKERWRVEELPKLHYALPMLVLLIASSFVLHAVERRVKQRNYGASRALLAVTILMGLGFMMLSALDYKEHWQTLTPYTDSYGSIFYTIVSFHAAHVIVGLLVLAYVLAMRRYAPAPETPYRPYHVAAMYWHFVDVVWIFVVGILYVGPHL